MAVFKQVAVLFLMMLCGLFSAKKKLITDEGLKGLNAVVLNFSLPCLAFAKLQRDKSPELMRELASVFLLSGLAMLLSGAVLYLVTKKETPARRAVFTSTGMFSNAIFMGFPVLTAAFGEDKLIYGVLYMAMFNLLSWSVGVMLFDRRGFSAKRLLSTPSLVASFLGLLCFVFGVRLPKTVLGAMDMMGAVTTPLAMLMVGARLGDLKARDVTDKSLLVTALFRLALLPLLVHFILLPLPVTPMARMTLSLCTAMPAAATTVMQAEKYGGDGALASKSVAVTTALSLATIPLILPIIL